MCHIEEKLEILNKMPAFYKRYFDDTLSKMPLIFLSTLNEIHPSLSFTMELENNFPFLVWWLSESPRPDTTVYVNPTDTGLLLHYQYKHSLLKTMLNFTFKLFSDWMFYHQEYERLKTVFARLHYPETLTENTMRHFIEMKVTKDVYWLNN